MARGSIYQIVLGSLAMTPAVERLLQRFADNRPERPDGWGETPLAIMIVDREGRTIPGGCTVVSSFAWGLPLALSGDPAALSEWEQAGVRLRDALHERLFREGPDGKTTPLDTAAITGAWTCLRTGGCRSGDGASARLPPARWPGPGRHPLALMQQAAVNLAVDQGAGEILAVNGPPGTGKTTLLLDVIAALVTKRASVMTTLDDPKAAFLPSSHKLKVGAGWLHLYRLDKTLKGFEMLIASSNNKAVENVSAELSAIGAVAHDAADLRYFKPLADGLLGSESWGAIAAVLGNAKNRATFKDRFWWDDETGLFAYLNAVDGRTPGIELPDGGR